MKDDLFSQMMECFSVLNRGRTFMQFQLYMKGENIFLHELVKMGGESTPTDLANKLGVTGPRVTAIINSLTVKKLVRKTKSGEDKRKLVVQITPKGEEWEALASDEALTVVTSVIDKLGEEDTKELVRIINKLIYPEKAAESNPKAIEEPKPQNSEEGGDSN